MSRPISSRGADDRPGLDRDLFGTDRLVTRWIMYLKRISGAYRAGHYTIRPSLEAAPGEFQLLGAALSDMASAIQDAATASCAMP
jgi:hypothetical protein